jgi:hypothetical protein
MVKRGRAQSFPQKLWTLALERSPDGRRLDLMNVRALCLTAAALSVAMGVAAEPSSNTRLNLPSYARPGADPLDAPALPTLTERVEVIGKPMDTEWLTAKMEWWLADFDLVYGSRPPIPGSAPSLEDMYEHRPHGPRGANFMPLLFWAAEKLNKK